MNTTVRLEQKQWGPGLAATWCAVLSLLSFGAIVASTITAEFAPSWELPWVAIPGLLLAATAFAVGVLRWPPLLFHGVLLGVVLDEWERLGSGIIPFLTITKLLFIMGAVLLLVAELLNRQKRTWVFPLPALAHLPFSALCLVSALAFAYSKPAGLRWATAPVTLPFLAIVLAQFVTDRKTAAGLLKAFAVYSFLPMLVALLELVLGRRLAGYTDFLLYGVGDIFRVGANYQNPNDFVVLMLFSIPILLGWAWQSRRRVVGLCLLVGAAFEAVVLLKTYSRHGYVAMAAGLVMLAVWGRGRVRKGAIMVCVAGGMVMLATPSVRDRLLTLAGVRQGAGVSQAMASVSFRQQLLEVGWDSFRRHPILGVGFSNIGTKAHQENMVLYAKSTIECLYLEVLAEMGLVGFAALALFLVCCWNIVLASLRNARGSPAEALVVGLAAGYLGFAVKGIFDTTLSYNLPWVLLPLLVQLGQPEMASGTEKECDAGT